MCHQVWVVFCRVRRTGYGGRGAPPHLGAWVQGRGGQQKAFTSGPVCSASLHTAWSHVGGQAPQIHCLDCPESAKRSGGTSRLTAGSDGGRTRSGDNRARRADGLPHASHDYATTGAWMEELMEHWFFIGGHPIKALFHNCPGSAKRSGERGKRCWSLPIFARPCNSEFAWQKAKRFSKTGPAPNASSSLDRQGLLLGPPYFKQIRRIQRRFAP